MIGAGHLGLPFHADPLLLCEAKHHHHGYHDDQDEKYAQDWYQGIHGEAICRRVSSAHE